MSKSYKQRIQFYERNIIIKLVRKHLKRCLILGSVGFSFGLSSLAFGLDLKSVNSCNDFMIKTIKESVIPAFTVCVDGKIVNGKDVCYILVEYNKVAGTSNNSGGKLLIDECEVADEKDFYEPKNPGAKERCSDGYGAGKYIKENKVYFGVTHWNDKNIKGCLMRIYTGKPFGVGAYGEMVNSDFILGPSSK